jgi:HEPN domain-containing protein
MPLNSRDFQKAARQRLATARFLLENDYTLDSAYLAGYAIECTLKALILEVTPEWERTETLGKVSSGSKMHNYDVLGGILKVLGHPIPLAMVKRLRRSGWSTDLRYMTGRKDKGETRAFLRTAGLVLTWVEGHLP